jgi:hypothetical protein
MVLGEPRGGNSLTDFLFARSSWTSGLARILDIGATFDDYNFGATSAQSDWLGLVCDLEMIRRDFWVALRAFDAENRGTFLKRKAEVNGASGKGLPEAAEMSGPMHGMTPQERSEYIKARLQAYHEKKKAAAERQRVFKEHYLLTAHRNRLRAIAVEKTLA